MGEHMTQKQSSTSAGRLAGQVALVTGGSSGIGQGVSLALAAAGANVVVNYASKPEGAEETKAQIEERGARALCVKADVSDEAQVKSLFEQAVDAFGAVDILVANAGVQRDAPIDEMKLEDWRKVIDVNLTGVFLCAREAVRLFKRQGVRGVSKAAGKIVCMSSVHDAIPWAGHANYAASKGGLMMFMKTLAQELAPYRIRVNSVCPGAIRTPINKSVWDDPKAYGELLELIPQRRMGEPSEIGDSVVYLVSDQADYVTGLNLYIDGGMMLYPGFESGG